MEVSFCRINIKPQNALPVMLDCSQYANSRLQKYRRCHGLCVQEVIVESVGVKPIILYVYRVYLLAPVRVTSSVSTRERFSVWCHRTITLIRRYHLDYSVPSSGRLRHLMQGTGCSPRLCWGEPAHLYVREAWLCWGEPAHLYVREAWLCWGEPAHLYVREAWLCWGQPAHLYVCVR